MDDADPRNNTPEADAKRRADQVDAFYRWWFDFAAREGEHEALVHAQRVVGGVAAGHWCNASAEQREAARRYLTARATCDRAAEDRRNGEDELWDETEAPPRDWGAL